MTDEIVWACTAVGFSSATPADARRLPPNVPTDLEVE